MKTKPLIKTNRYLRDPAMRKRLNDRSVISSCGVEGIKLTAKRTNKIKIKRRKKELFNKLKAKLMND